MTKLSNILLAALTASSVTAFAPVLNNQNRNKIGLDAEPITLDGQEIRGDITPLGNFVLVRTKDTLAATGGGILLPDQVSFYSQFVFHKFKFFILCLSHLFLKLFLL